MKIPVNEPVITEASKKYVQEAVETGWISSAGKFIQQFEESFAEFIGTRHAITTTSGTSALHLGLCALNIGPGDEVILPNLTMGACMDAILYTGATPVLVDIERDTFNIDPKQIEAHLSEKTKAIMAVHLFGHSADMDPIRVIAQEHGIAILEDAAEVHGGTYKGRMCGSMGTIGCFSFYGNKIITTGEGGMVVTDNDALAARARSLKDLAHDAAKRFWHKEIGFNYRMTNLQAALGLGQLESVKEFLRHKEWLGQQYTEKLKDIEWLDLPVTREGIGNVYWMYIVLVNDKSKFTRDELRAKLLERGIDTRDIFYPLSDQPFANTSRKDDSYPVSADIAKRGFYLPSGLALTQEQLDYVADTLHSIENT
ncbi:MAG: DegT/DnrJ/EryC1/StrS family aminotransferase [Candidatus Peribacteraceae bacterium]|nr:DegT/DnrJ/EryC1/StrS family aminotransferase [Candidatus Peribacteraceae bacterium]